jgi:hypothetical protein
MYLGNVQARLEVGYCLFHPAVGDRFNQDLLICIDILGGQDLPNRALNTFGENIDVRRKLNGVKTELGPHVRGECFLEFCS